MSRKPLKGLPLEPAFVEIPWNGLLLEPSLIEGSMKPSPLPIDLSIIVNKGMLVVPFKSGDSTYALSCTVKARHVLDWRWWSLQT